MKAFYFANKEKTLRYGDNRPIVVGKTHTVECKPIVCQQGLHASIKPLDALQYASYHNLYLVELGGDMDIVNDKIAATKRTYIDFFDAENLLREFSRKQALINIEKIKPYCGSEDYQLTLNWLNTGNELLREAVSSAAYLAANEMLVNMIVEATGWDIEQALKGESDG